MDSKYDSINVYQIILSILLPPAILMLEFKSQAEMSHVPQTYEHPQPCRETGTQGVRDTGHVGMVNTPLGLLGFFAVS